MFEFKVETEDGEAVTLQLKDYSKVPGRVSLDHIGDMEAQVWASLKWGLAEPKHWPEESEVPGWSVLRYVPMDDIMDCYNKWQTAAKITAPESRASLG